MGILGCVATLLAKWRAGYGWVWVGVRGEVICPSDICIATLASFSA